MAVPQTEQTDASLNIEVASPSSAPAKKVELDLDDAPFLQAEEKAPEPVPIEDELDPDAEAGARRRRRKKIMILSVAGGLILVLACVAVWWFFFRAPPTPPPEGPKPDVVVVPSQAAPAQQQDLVREFAPFVVPTIGPDGKDAFLVCKFSAISHDANVNREMEQQVLPLRDAIYYYLRSKNNAFLLDAHNGDEIKKDLLSVFNDYLTQGKLEDIVFESYLSK